ncbi:cation diffusion facilitator family transporter [Candidatus Latescibacterota bacterium]
MTALSEQHDAGQDSLHGKRRMSLRRLWLSFFINAGFLVVEFVGGILSNSLALLADAGHMLTDVAALALAIVVAKLALTPPTPRRTYGLLRAEVLGAFINGAVLVFIVGVILWEAWRRIGSQVAINGPLMLTVATLGLAANAVSTFILWGGRRENVNVKGAYLHMLADTLGSLGAITAGVVILLTGWTPIDQIVSVLIGILILVGSWELLSETAGILLETTPPNIDYDEIKDALMSVDHVQSIHDLHIWSIASGFPAMSAHIQLSPDCSDSSHWQVCLREVQTMLREKYGIEHSTLQIEPENYVRDNRSV